MMLKMHAWDSCHTCWDKRKWQKDVLILEVVEASVEILPQPQKTGNMWPTMGGWLSCQIHVYTPYWTKMMIIVPVLQIMSMDKVWMIWNMTMNRASVCNIWNLQVQEHRQFLHQIFCLLCQDALLVELITSLVSSSIEITLATTQWPKITLC